MRAYITVFCILLVAVLASCDLRSGTAKQEMEKWVSTPTPPFSPTPTPIPIDPADIVKVDASQDGDTIHVDGYGLKTTKNCAKFNRVMVNGDANVVTIKGVCKQIMINGDKNEVTVDASMEFVFNGTDNNAKFARYPNGKQPSVIDNQSGNIVEKVAGKTPAKR
jgi:hypothetical protein